MRLQRRPTVEGILGQLGALLRVVVARVLDNSFPDLEGEIQSREIGVALLEGFHDAQRVQVVVEALPIFLHDLVQAFFPGVSERRMADVVSQRQSLHQVFVQSHESGHGARDLGDFNGVGQPVAEMIGKPRREYLRLVFQAAEGARVHHAVAVALVIIAVGMPRLGEAASAPLFRLEGKFSHG